MLAVALGRRPLRLTVLRGTHGASYPVPFFQEWPWALTVQAARPLVRVWRRADE